MKWYHTGLLILELGVRIPLDPPNLENKMSDIKPFKLSEILRNRVKEIQAENAHKVMRGSITGSKSIDINALALTQDLESVINRSRELRRKNK